MSQSSNYKLSFKNNVNVIFMKILNIKEIT